MRNSVGGIGTFRLWLLRLVTRQTGCWQRAVDALEKATQPQFVYTDKSGEAQGAARPKAVEHSPGWFLDRTNAIEQNLEQRRELARTRRFNAKECLHDGGVPERWLRPAVVAPESPGKSIQPEQELAVLTVLAGTANLCQLYCFADMFKRRAGGTGA